MPSCRRSLVVFAQIERLAVNKAWVGCWREPIARRPIDCFAAVIRLATSAARDERAKKDDNDHESFHGDPRRNGGKYSYRQSQAWSISVSKNPYFLGRKANCLISRCYRRVIGQSRVNSICTVFDCRRMLARREEQARETASELHHAARWQVTLAVSRVEISSKQCRGRAPRLALTHLPDRYKLFCTKTLRP